MFSNVTFIRKTIEINFITKLIIKNLSMETIAYRIIKLVKFNSNRRHVSSKLTKWDERWWRCPVLLSSVMMWTGWLITAKWVIVCEAELNVLMLRVRICNTYSTSLKSWGLVVNSPGSLVCYKRLLKLHINWFSVFLGTLIIQSFCFRLVLFPIKPFSKNLFSR